MTSKLNSTFLTPLILASKSPRRAQLLKNAGYQFEPFSLEVSEFIEENLNCFDSSQYLSELKMKAFIKKHGLKSVKYSFALTCDTLVEFQNQALGKPTSINQALGWLLEYSGKTQYVHTGCSLLKLDGKAKQKNWVSTTKVFFKTYTKKEAELYLKKNNDILSKAGGYGIQDPKFNLVEKIEGEFSNVVGLPLKDLSKEIKNWDF